LPVREAPHFAPLAPRPQSQAPRAFSGKPSSERATNFSSARHWPRRRQPN
jgi:hypothetical protein